MRIHILYPFRDGAWGGANQFLKALRDALRRKGVYAEDPSEADVIIFDSFRLPELERLNEIYRYAGGDTVTVQRIDGPLTASGRKYWLQDQFLYTLNRFMADGSIFQSAWSRDANKENGYADAPSETVIHNAPDDRLFNTTGAISFDRTRRTRLIAISFSGRYYQKGFDVYEWLDHNLDFSKYEMTLVGRSPVSFRNIRHVSPLAPHDLAHELKQHDMFISAPRTESCSNALLEAMHCGLLPIARNSSSHPELIGEAGLLFDSPEEIPALLTTLAEQYEQYQARLSLPTIHDIAERYRMFAENIVGDRKNNRYYPKQTRAAQYWLLRGLLRMSALRQRMS